MVARMLKTLFIFWALTNGAWLHAKDEVNSIEHLMNFAGSTHVIEQLIEEMELEQIKEKISLLNGGLTPFEERLYFKQLQLTHMKNNVKERLSQTLPEAELAGLLDFYKQPLIQKMFQLRKDFDQGESERSTKNYLRSLIGQPPTRQRIELMHQLVDVSLLVEQQIYLSAVITYEKNKVPMEFHDRYGEEEAQKLEYHIERYKENMVDAIRPEVRVVFMNIYASLSDDEIAQLIELLQKKSRLSYQAAFVDAMAEVLAESVRAGILGILNHRSQRSS